MMLGAMGAWMLIYGLVSLGCVPLPAYQRAVLMTRVMADPYDQHEAAALAHVIEVREAMAGASAASGASCGCR